jgi:hypothetical protein
MPELCQSFFGVFLRLIGLTGRGFLGTEIAVTADNSDRRPRVFGTGTLLRLGIAIGAAWVAALIAAAVGVPLLAVLVLALIVSAGVFRALQKWEAPK